MGTILAEGKEFRLPVKIITKSPKGSEIREHFKRYHVTYSYNKPYSEASENYWFVTL